MFKMIKMFIITIFLTIHSVNSLWVTVPTGNVVVWYKWQKMQKEVGAPGGVYFYNALTTDYQIVDVTSQMDAIKNIEVVTLDKQKATLPSIKVWNQLPLINVTNVLSVFEKKHQNIPYDRALIYDPVINYVKEICSEYTGEQLRSDNYKDLNEMIKTFLTEYQMKRPELNGKDTGLKILKVFVEIPRLSLEVEKNYQDIAKHKTAEQAEHARQKSVLKQKETNNKVEEFEAIKQLAVASTKNRQDIEEAEAGAKMEKIKSESDADKIRIAADAESYAAHKKATSNQELLTKEYLQLYQFEKFGCQNHFGDLPNFLQISDSALKSVASDE